MACHADCKRPTPAQCHCSVCHLTFGSVSAFDWHRRNGKCLTPADHRMFVRDRVWRIERPGAAERLAALKDAAE